MAIPIPSIKVSTNKIDGVIILYIVRMLRIIAIISIQLLIIKRNLRRSKISERAPVGTINNTTARLVVAYIIAIKNGECVSVVINHEAPITCIEFPIFVIINPIQNSKNI